MTVAPPIGTPLIFVTRPAALNVCTLNGDRTMLQLLLVALAGWINQQQREVIEYLRTEHRVVREHLGSRRLPFTGDQRIRLAAKARRLRRRVLLQFHTIVRPTLCSRCIGISSPANMTAISGAERTATQDWELRQLVVRSSNSFD